MSCPTRTRPGRATARRGLFVISYESGPYGIESGPYGIEGGRTESNVAGLVHGVCANAPTNAGGGTRTRKPFQAGDFKSPVFTDFTTPAGWARHSFVVEALIGQRHRLPGPTHHQRNVEKTSRISESQVLARLGYLRRGFQPVFLIEAPGRTSFLLAVSLGTATVLGGVRLRNRGRLRVIDPLDHLPA